MVNARLMGYDTENGATLLINNFRKKEDEIMKLRESKVKS